MPNPKKLLETLYGVPMQDGGKLPPGIKRATERAKESKSVLPVAGARQARQAIQGYLGMDPSFSVMDPEAQALESAYRGGETASVLGDLVASLTPFATASALSKANQVPGLAELIAYHGSPHKFKKFDASKIGTGEGAQAYGHGLYFAENPAVAKDYRKELATEVTIDGKPYFTGGRKVSSTGDKTIDDFLTWHVGDVAKAIEAAKRMGFDEYIPKLEALKDRVKRVQGGALYTVDIPDEKIAQMLDWDKPLSQQPVAMQVARKVFNDPQRKSAGFPSITDEEIGNLTGQDLYRAMTTTRGGLQPGASKSLLQEGIPGIQYLDQVSRNKPLKDIKREFLNELPENASIDEVVELLGTGTFSPKNEAIIKELAANDWLGFDYPAQSLSTVLSPSARNYDLSPSLMRAINEAQEGGTRNFVVFPGEEQNIKMLDINGEPQMAKGGKVHISDNLDTMRLELMRAPRMQVGGALKALKGGKGAASAAKGAALRPGQLGFDLRFDPRVKERQRLLDLSVLTESKPKVEIPKVSLVDYEGRPFVTSMSDRTAGGGMLTEINNIDLKRPVELQGGQDFMFYNPMAWASGKIPAGQILEQARLIKSLTGQDPLYIPWRMAPTGGDFATFTGETMLSFAESALGKADKRSLNKRIKDIIPDWPGIDSPNSFDVYRRAPDAKRKTIKNMLDVEFRDQGGLGIGEARLAVADPRQLQGFDTQIMNIGEIHADRPLIQGTGHYSYPYGVPGGGLGEVDREIGVLQLLPDVVNVRRITNPTSPGQTDIRALQMKPYAGILTDKVLKDLGY